MSNNFKTKLIQPIIYNLTLILIFLILTEAIFGQWFDKNSFGPYMREHRMKKQKRLNTMIKMKKLNICIYEIIMALEVRI